MGHFFFPQRFEERNMVVRYTRYASSFPPVSSLVRQHLPTRWIAYSFNPTPPGNTLCDTSRDTHTQKFLLVNLGEDLVVLEEVVLLCAFFTKWKHEKRKKKTSVNAGRL
jgi:hypothetical protein